VQNIDPLYILEPVVVIALSVGLILYWRKTRSFTRYALIFSLVAYAGAILAKVIVRLFTANSVISAFGGESVATGVYYGIQTSLFEVGGAFLVARYAVSRKRFSQSDAGAYGISLSFWENGIYLGVFSLISLVSIYAVLAIGPPSTAQEVYTALETSQGGLFDSLTKALPQIGFGILERISSILAHYSWGYLCVLAAVFKRNSYFAIALPMGFIDFFLPFVGVLGVPLFETIVFLFSLASLLIAISIGKNLPKLPAVQGANPASKGS